MSSIPGAIIHASHVLLIDDDPSIHALVAAMLKPLNVRLTATSSAEAGWTASHRERPDLILLDNEMPGVTGLELLARLKADATLQDVPVVMETGSESHRTLAACFASGAVDYIRKPFTAAELRARVGSVLERQRMLAELTRAAHFDRLTGLANRALLHDRLTHAIAQARQGEGNAFALMFLDFDRFKLVNDSLGHDVGDLLLVAIAARLRANLRESDTMAHGSLDPTVARLGGDEFVAIVSGVRSPSVATAIAERLLACLRAPYELGAHIVRSSASIGVVCSAPEYKTADEMLRDADIAMYEAKTRGKSCQVAFSSGMRDAVRARLETENDLRDALGTDQLHLAFQPIVSLDDRSLCGVESLARWTHPVRGNVPPDLFIPVAEESRLILPMSEWILRESCAAFMRWQHSHPAVAPSYVSVNLSCIQLCDTELVTRTMQVLHDCGMTPTQLQYEVTESQVMQNRTAGLRMLTELRACGVRLAMDDFGTGYSSLSCLQEFPLDVLKVDRSFVANARRGRDYAALLHAVVTLADNLGLKVVAEGIEDEDQLVLLQALGCAFGQGYLIARPMSESALQAMLDAITYQAAGLPVPRSAEAAARDAARDAA